jgi:hypothetical protein
MPASTPNRGYPYSIPADPADVAGALEDLATAIDTDLTTIAPTIRRRRVARATQPGSVSFGTTATTVAIPFSSLPVNEGTAVAVFPASPNDRIYPSWPGLWFVTASLSFFEADVSANPAISQIDIAVDRNTTRIGRQTMRNRTAGAGTEQIHTLTASGARLMNGTTDYYRVASNIVRPAANPNGSFSVFGCSLTMWQMTLS